MELQETSIYRKNKEYTDPFLSEGKKEGKKEGKTSREQGSENGKKRFFKDKIPDFWNAKYRCILMGVILFFSVIEIVMFNLNNFLNGESTKSILNRFLNKYLTLNDTLKHEKHD